MAAANASARGLRRAILESPLREMHGFRLAVDCRSAGCRGERTYLIVELARAFGANVTVGEVLRRMRCTHGCGGRVLVASIETGPAINARARPRRVPLLAPDAKG